MSAVEGLRVREVTGAERQTLIPWADRFDPESCVVVDRLTDGQPRRRCRVWVAESLAGDTLGLVLFDQVCLDRWIANPLLDDPVAAQALAPVIDAGPAWAVEGVARHVAPFIGRLDRVMDRPPTTQTFVHMDHDVISEPGMTALLDEQLGPVDDRSRLARASDLGALVDLYESYEYQRIPTRRRLRASLARVLDRLPVIVTERDGKLVGAMRGEAMSARTILWDDSTVLPEYRNQRLWLGLARRGLHTAIQLGRGSAGILQPSNRLQIPEELPEWWDSDPGELKSVFIRLRPPVYFRGQNRLRQVAEAVEGRRRPRAL